jgi:hypothetical protein
VYHNDGRRGRDEGSQGSGDEITLRDIQRCIDAEGSEERK